MEPFHLSYGLTRRQRLATELLPWLPAIAATLGFGVGAAYLSVAASRWFLVLLLGPVIVYRGLFGFVFDIVFRARRRVVLLVSETAVEVAVGREHRAHPLDGIIQVFRAGDTWTVLHLDGTELTIPVDAITDEQIGYLRSFARRAAAARA